MSEQTQKLREALQYAEACLTNKLSTRTKHEYALDLIHEALAMPTEPSQPVGELPKLPEPDLSFEDGEDQWGYPAYAHAYSADQMRDYGTKCWKAGYKHGKRVQYLDSN